jgi:hypothetical protein
MGDFRRFNYLTAHIIQSNNGAESRRGPLKAGGIPSWGGRRTTLPLEF